MMKAHNEDPNRVLQTIRLSDRLAEDIRLRGLEPGAPYYTTQEASRFLKVAGTFANQALQLLEKRQIIKRSQRLGSFVQSVPEQYEHDISHVTFLIYDHYFRKEGAGSGDLMAGLQAELPMAHVELGLLQANREEDLVIRIIKNALANNEVDAFVLFSTSFAVQQIIMESGFPAVIHGTPHFSIDLPYLERDHAEAHRRIIQHLRSRKRKNLVYMIRDIIRPGDKVSMAAFRKFPEFTKETPILFTTENEDEITAEIQNLYDSGYRPDAFICNSIVQAEMVEEIMRGRKLTPYQDADIIVATYYLQRGAYAKYTHIEIDLSSEEIGRTLGRMLKEKSKGQAVQNRISPVRLVLCQRE
ncbi:MAG: hypothetical protein Q4G69_08685 [Planctomycetia bacterium]|nr:hypothetical protein [Planctomycetia bacterium]